jgi:hypothetical protein
VIDVESLRSGERSVVLSVGEGFGRGVGDGVERDNFVVDINVLV